MPSLAWNMTERYEAEKATGILDAFVKIGRSDDPRWQLDSARAFAERWGPWGYCEQGHQHFPELSWTEPQSFRPLPPKPERVLTERVADTVVAARQVNALRSIVLRLWGIASTTEPDDDWAQLLRPWLDRHGADFVPDYRRNELKFALMWVDTWLESSHVIPLADFNAPAVLRVQGASGALAVEMVREISSRPMVASCPRCKVTHYRQGRANQPHLCQTCQSLYRNRKPKTEKEAPG